MESESMKRIILGSVLLIMVLVGCLVGPKFKTRIDEKTKTIFYIPNVFDYYVYFYVSRNLITNECNMRMKVRNMEMEEDIHYTKVKIGTEKCYLNYETVPEEHERRIDRVYVENNTVRKNMEYADFPIPDNELSIFEQILQAQDPVYIQFFGTKEVLHELSLHEKKMLQFMINKYNELLYLY